MQPIVCVSGFERILSELQRISVLESADSLLKRIQELQSAMGIQVEEKKKPLAGVESERTDLAVEQEKIGEEASGPGNLNDELRILE